MLCGLYLAPNHHYLKGTQQWIDKLLKYESTMCKFQIFVYPAIYIDMIHFSLLNKNEAYFVTYKFLQNLRKLQFTEACWPFFSEY